MKYLEGEDENSFYLHLEILFDYKKKENPG